MGFLFFNSLFSAAIVSILLLFHCAANASNVTHDSRAFLIDGNRRILISGSIHYPRSSAQMWPDLVRKAKEGGLDAVETYVFWNVHEPVRRQYDFNGNLDLIRFIKTVEAEGLYVILRIGPYVCAEWNYGGLPVWLHNMPGVKFRTINEVFQNEMENFTKFIVNMVKKEKLFASQGGPIILSQIENEHGNFWKEFGEAGKAYIQWCAKMADGLKIGVPWIMCNQGGAPKPMVEACNGFYCHGDEKAPQNKDNPKVWAENWTGWFKDWHNSDPHRPAEDIAYAVARFFQKGGSLMNYYMYHGGTNFGRTSGGPYITTSYDYDAPLDEYGNLRQPKWGHLKQLHDALHRMEYALAYGVVNHTSYGNGVWATVYRTNDKSSCFLCNDNAKVDANINFGGLDYFIPARSVSFLPDCKEEVYNTAKVYAQTSNYVKKPNKAEDEPSSLKWLWRPENLEATVVQGKGDFSVNNIIDQKDMANDASDYLWYMTSFELRNDDPMSNETVLLSVGDSGQVLHVFVNGAYIGSKWSIGKNRDYTFEQYVSLSPGHNLITLLSVQVGLAHYDYEYDLQRTGILTPVKLILEKGNNTIVKDLSSNKWSYKIGMDGFTKKIYETKVCSKINWSSDSLRLNRNFTWYKTTFKAPLGNEPVVVDLLGLGKGVAWVNGHNIGRYWPTALAGEPSCDNIEYCDYRSGIGFNSICRDNCNEPTQRWYHIPRSFLKDGENTLVLFEEFGGNPTRVLFQTVEIGSACVNAYEGKEAELSCNNRTISGVKFASFGNPQGVCGSFKQSNCVSKVDLVSLLEKECVGKKSCSFEVSEDKFGWANCERKRLAVEVECQE
ncbi:hypothetical protein PTKIN_Ptkin19aG0091000 [Pterospermum kingtungense]